MNSTYDIIRLSHLSTEDNHPQAHNVHQDVLSETNQTKELHLNMLSASHEEFAQPDAEYAIVGTTGAPKIPEKSEALEDYLKHYN